MISTIKRWIRRAYDRKGDLFLVIGDVLVLSIALGVSLWLWYFSWPEWEVLLELGVDFGALFTLFLVIFFIAGLYNEGILVLKHRVPELVLYSWIANFLVAALFFYFGPWEIMSRLFLVLYFVVGFFVFYFWRMKVRDVVLGGQDRRQALLIGSGPEMKELKEEVNNNPIHGFRFISSIDLDKVDSIDIREEVLAPVYSEEVGIIGADLRHQQIEAVLPYLYNLMFYKVRFVDMQGMYEEVFERVPLSAFHYNWFLENISIALHTPYDVLKRGIDIAGGLLLGALFLLSYPLIYLSFRLEGVKKLVVWRKCVGMNNHHLKLPLFTTLGSNEEVGKVGKFLHRWGMSRLPEFWYVIRGDLSLIGPRPVGRKEVERNQQDIPYYNVRHLIRPGLWQWGRETAGGGRTEQQEASLMLSYDLYYLKNRSLAMDLRVIGAKLRYLFIGGRKSKQETQK